MCNKIIQAGESTKLIKEITGHVSDAVEKYQITSDEQGMHASVVIQGHVPVVKLSQAPEMQIVNDLKLLTNDQKFELP